MDDAPLALELFGHPEVQRFLPGANMSDLAGARAMMERIRDKYYVPSNGALGAFALFDKDGGAFAGNLLLKAAPDAAGELTTDIEIGWHLLPSRWGQGLASEGASACLRYGFDTLALPEIHALVLAGNARSMRVAERIGLLYRGSTDRYYGMAAEHFSRAR